jgi:hypothetical protein
VLALSGGPGVSAALRFERWGGGLVLLAAVVLAGASARDWAGGYNDGSRLATVESLADGHTLAIDDSIFVRPALAGPPGPYDPDTPGLNEHGTGDKLLISGRFYSDKPPVPALLLAGLYKGLQVLGLPTARARPDRFCWAMTLASSGLAYVVAVWCVWLTGAALRLPPWPRLALTASFGLATVALAYTSHVNGHIQLLAVAAAVLLLLTRWLHSPDGPGSTARLLLCGLLAGLGYAIEQPTGGLLAGAAVLLALARRRVGAGLLLAQGALPFAVLHHALTYAYAGTLGPPNAVPAFFDYPGSDFTAESLTGIYNHDSVASLLVYAGGLLFGVRGFLQVNLPLLLAVPALFLVRRTPEWPLAVLAGAWGVGVWAVFALLSTNYSGSCCSIRWFVPLLAAGYFLLVLLLRERPDWLPDFLVLSAWGAVLGAQMAREGTWQPHVPVLWHVQAGALATWLALTRHLRLLEGTLAFLPRLGWPLLAVCTLGPALVALPPLDFPGLDVAERGRDGQAAVLVLLGFLVGVRARADRREGPAAPWLTLGLALLAAGLAAWGPAPRPLAVGFWRLVEDVVRDADFANRVYTGFFTFWLLWACARLGRRLRRGWGVVALPAAASLGTLLLAGAGWPLDPLAPALAALALDALLSACAGSARSEGRSR